ncbi:hypothetical protein GGI18_000719 [Coemansia linderi]|uniref:Uncharacterized protein n=1 Tax=Coemansia linderi TaxID=2663919 RepID=A0ACC1KNJ3_9FUNG|nr:hypothetical protein GGI18_000719 [Coemansia linderi]
MKITSAFIALAALIGAGVDAQANCQSNVVRKEIRSLSPTEWNRVTSVVRNMSNSGWLGWFAHIHNQYFGVIHGNEFFFPWHRRFIRDFESIAQSVDRGFVLPYWDELRDFANPAASEVMSAKFVGTNGQGDGCVRDGNQAGTTLNYPSNHCLRRRYNAGNRINAWYSPEFIQSVLSRSTRMSQLRPGIEFSLHGAIHLAMGGDMLENYSPNDFVFWIHHANIDRIWSVWQTMNPNQNFWSMDGVDNNGRPMGYGTLLPHYNEPVINSMRMGVNGMCFFYDNGGSITNKRRSLLERRGNTKKCIPRLPANLPPMPPIVDGVFNNVDILPVPADTYVQVTIAQKLPPVVLDKWFPTFTGGAAPNVTANAPSAPYAAVAIPNAPYVPDTVPSPPSYSNIPPPYSYSTVPINAGYSTVSDSSIYGSSSTGGYSTVPNNGGYSTVPGSSSSGSYNTVSDSSVSGSSSSGSSSSGSNSYSTSAEDGSYSASDSDSDDMTSDEQEGEYSTSGSSSGIYTGSPLPSDTISSLYNSSAAPSSSSSSVYSEEYHAFDPVDDAAPQGPADKGLKYPMPNPFPMTAHFIKMHNYPIDQIHKEYLIAREFVKDMNAAGYQSPFAKGATA